jgi:hypothetical protein
VIGSQETRLVAILSTLQASTPDTLSYSEAYPDMGLTSTTALSDGRGYFFLAEIRWLASDLLLEQEWSRNL